jgi:hypothetical protein
MKKGSISMNSISMNRRQFLGASTLILAGTLSACRTGGGPNQDLAQQFLTERNGGTPVAIGAGGPNAPILGFIESLDGPQFTVKRPTEAGITTVQLADSAKIHKDVDAQFSEITAGTSVTAFGTRQGDVFQADLLRLGSDAGAGGDPVVSYMGGVAGGPPASGQDQIITSGPIGPLPQPVTGIVETIAGGRVVLKDQDGASTTVTLAGNGKIQKSAEVAPAELTVGTFIMAIGVQNGEVYQATQVRILPVPQER